MEPITGPSTPAHRPIRILIVDDTPQVRQALRLLLELSGEVEVAGEAASGAEAIANAELLHPPVILMDLVMPGEPGSPAMDGFEAARQIKARLPDCRVIAFSVHSAPEARQRASQAGMDGLIEKGAPLAEILRWIAQI